MSKLWSQKYQSTILSLDSRSRRRSTRSISQNRNPISLNRRKSTTRRAATNRRTRTRKRSPRRTRDNSLLSHLGPLQTDTKRGISHPHLHPLNLANLGHTTQKPAHNNIKATGSRSQNSKRKLSLQRRK